MVLLNKNIEITFPKYLCWYCYFLDIAYLKATLPQSIEEAFFEFLQQLNVNNVIVYAIEEGSVVFPKLVSLILYYLAQVMKTSYVKLVKEIHSYSPLKRRRGESYRTHKKVFKQFQHTYIDICKCLYFSPFGALFSSDWE